MEEITKTINAEPKVNVFSAKPMDHLLLYIRCTPLGLFIPRSLYVDVAIDISVEETALPPFQLQPGNTLTGEVMFD